MEHKPDDGHEHAVSPEADRGGQMDGKCIHCGIAICRDSYGSFCGPWRPVHA